MKEYLQEHLRCHYLPGVLSLGGLRRFRHKSGWDDWYLGDFLVFSHRTTDYTADSFPEGLHSHDFYEMDIYLAGRISYVSNDIELFPSPNDIVLFPPRCPHTARLLRSSCYERYVLYFSRQVFAQLPVPELYARSDAGLQAMEDPRLSELHSLLTKIQVTLEEGQADAAIVFYGYVLQLLHLIATGSRHNSDSIHHIPSLVQSIRSYVDKNCGQITSVTQIAAYHYYSREYVSRLFKKYYNIPLSRYLTDRKLDLACSLLEQGKSISFAFDSCGFHSMSAFLQAFRQRTGLTPSQYRSKLSKNSTQKKENYHD